MARGEADFEAGGAVWHIRFGNREFCGLEDRLARPWAEIARDLDGAAFSFGTFREVMRVGLSREHKNLTNDAVSDLIDEIGIAEAARLVGECIRAAMPQAAASGEAQAAARAGGSTGTT